MKFGEAWNQAAETTGVDQVSVEINLGFAILILSLEIAWWVGLGLFIRRRHLQRENTADEL